MILTASRGSAEEGCDRAYFGGGFMTLYSASKQKATWKIDNDEAILIHTETASYFSMNQSGTWLWSKITERPYPMSQLLHDFADHYRLDRQQAQADLERFLLQLRNADLLIESSGDDAAIAESVSRHMREGPDPYEPPDLVRFGDLETLILSGE